ncbi:MAG: RIP metalloprotease RseP [Flavobacteriales bacterium]|nr:MAG: RIP metalloprotease RseP [Flavobacteriales bacterium]CAI8392118.1 MAG: Putative zinc metalloprotease [Flavobacteriales bacterium]|tara:strand:+ start:7997 stop:9316 length:1320 start_codon:yes stop_codon:yes gene_type:complete
MTPEFFIKAGQLLLSLSILIVLHELGHFIPAKLFGTRVEKFYLFFDVKYSLFKKKIGDTVYGIGWLPLGGYVKISGMIDESFDKEQMSKPPQPWEFRSKPAWQRLIIMLGGVTVNLVLGFLIYMMVLFVWGKETLPQENIPLGMEPSAVIKEIGFEKGDKIINVDGKELDNVLSVNRILLLRPVEKIKVEKANGKIEEISIPENIGNEIFQSGQINSFTPLFSAIIDSVSIDSPALYAGMQGGDKIVSINDEIIYDWASFTSWIDNNSDDIIDVVVDRGGSNYRLSIDRNDDGTLGVWKKDYGIETINEKVGFTDSIIQGFNYGYWTLYEYVAGFSFVFTKKGAQQLGGFGTIGNLFPAKWDWKGFWLSTALISIILAFMNVLPIPALDGGHVMFLVYEMITGRRPSDRFMEISTMIGFFLLIALVLYANLNDVFRAFA